MNEEELRSRIDELHVPDQEGAERRAWEVVRAAYENERESKAAELETGRRTGERWPEVKSSAFRAWGLLIVLAAGAIVISPARALVADWVRDAVQGPDVRSTTVSTSPPGGGRLLVQSPTGTWATGTDGSRRHLGDFDDSTWSPRGRFIAAVDDHQLVALTPDGETRWALTRPTRPYLPSWNAPDGFRLAYLEGRQLRLVAGDGTGDTRLASGVEPVRPSWRAGPAHELAFALPGGRVKAISADTGEALFTASVAGPVKGLQWSDDGSRLLVWTAGSAVILNSRGQAVWSYSPGPKQRIRTASLRPGRPPQALLLVRGGASTRAILVAPGRSPRIALSAKSLTDPTWSPDGARLMLAWPEADQWLFLQGGNLERVDALGDVSSQFSPGSETQGRFPTVAGWCCTR